MSRIFILLAALALVLSPMTASARSADCGMRGERVADPSMAMPMAGAHDDHRDKPPEPGCRRGKGCAAACGQTSALVVPAAIHDGAAAWGRPVRPDATAASELVSRALSPERPPPRTLT